MLTHNGLVARAGLEHTVADPDYDNSISSQVVRCEYDGQRAVAVGCDATAKTQIGALLDLLDLHLTDKGRYQGIEVEPDAVTLLLGGPPNGKSEAVDAIGTLVRAMRSGPRVRVLEHRDEAGWVAAAEPPVDLGDLRLYPGWPALLDAVPDEPPRLVTQLIQRVGNTALRAYPMLTLKGRWSLRLEGLEVGRLSSRGARLDVGKIGKGGGQSAAREVWTSVVGAAASVEVADDAASLDRAATVLKAFSAAWLPPPGTSVEKLEQNEHALESRILRGAVQITAEGRPLELLRPHATVNWGSQFPTKWGRGGSPRYLDALLRDGETPWAIEMKVQGGGGVGQYYRHAIAQAVLYREFIAAASPLHSWFTGRHQLDPKACRAAVVVPELQGAHAPWIARLQPLCDLFDVALVQVPHKWAELRRKAV